LELRLQAVPREAALELDKRTRSAVLVPSHDVDSSAIRRPGGDPRCPDGLLQRDSADPECSLVNRFRHARLDESFRDARTANLPKYGTVPDSAAPALVL